MVDAVQAADHDRQLALIQASLREIGKIGRFRLEALLEGHQ